MGSHQKGGWTRNFFIYGSVIIFYDYTPSSRPLLLIMDGHSSHYCPQTIRLAALEQVILFTLPPNTTHITAPLDKGCFGPFKSAWKESVHIYMAKNPGKVVTRYNFSSLFNDAWMKSMTVKNVMSGFKVAGIYPFDRNAVRFPQKLESSLAAASGIKYIPLLTPSKSRQPRPSLYEDMSSQSDSSSEDRVQMPPFEPSPDKVEPAARRKLLSFKVPSPVYKEKIHQPKQSNRVLTSLENMRALEEKERKKEKEAKEKAEKQQLREQKRAEKQRAKQKRAKQKCDFSENFTPDEINVFERRLENGYDLEIDDRYNQWLKLRHMPSHTDSCFSPDLNQMYLSEDSRLSKSESEDSLLLCDASTEPEEDTVSQSLASMNRRAKKGITSQPAAISMSTRAKKGPKFQPLSTSSTRAKDTASQSLVAVSTSMRAKSTASQLLTTPTMGITSQPATISMCTRAKKGTTSQPLATTSRSTRVKKGTMSQSLATTSMNTRAKEDSTSQSLVTVSKSTRVKNGNTSRGMGEMNTTSQSLTTTSMNTRAKNTTSQSLAAVSTSTRAKPLTATSRSTRAKKCTRSKSLAATSKSSFHADLMCEYDACKYPDENNWVMCESCNSWFHCMCVEVPIEEAKNQDYHYFCC